MVCTYSHQTHMLTPMAHRRAAHPTHWGQLGVQWLAQGHIVKFSNNSVQDWFILTVETFAHQLHCKTYDSLSSPQLYWLIMDQMTAGNVKWDTRSLKHVEFSYKLVLLTWPKAVLFWFRLTVFTSIISGCKIAAKISVHVIEWNQ